MLAYTGNDERDECENHEGGNLKRILLLLLILGWQSLSIAEPLSSDGGLSFKPKMCPELWFKMGGRLQCDETVFAGNYQEKQNNVPSGANIRRLYTECSGGIGQKIDFLFRLAYHGSNANFERAWIGFNGLVKNLDVHVGELKPPCPIENYGSNLDYFFLEHSLASSTFSLLADRALGVLAEYTFCDHFAVQASLYQPRQDEGSSGSQDNNYENPTVADRLGEAVRLTFAPIHEKGNVFHVGCFARHQSTNDSLFGLPVFNRLFMTRPEALARNTRPLINAGPIRMRGYYHTALEGAVILGSATLQTEYHQVLVQRVPIRDRNDDGNLTFYGGHIEGGYIVTGESREYKFETGSIANPKPLCSYGAWELIARYSMVNLIDKNVYGGKEHNVSLGLNWFVNNNLRIVFNYIRAYLHPTNVRDPGTVPVIVKTQLDIAALRFQVWF